MSRPLETPLDEKSSEHRHELPHTAFHDGAGVDGELTTGFARQRTSDVEEPTLHGKTILVIASLCFSAFGINIGVTGAGFWLSYVIASLGPSPVAIFFAEAWLILQVGITPVFGTSIGFLIAVVSFCSGLMSDFGAPTRKWVCVGLQSFAVIGLIIAGSAHNWTIAIFGISLFGTAVVTYGPGAAIASDIVPRRMRGFIQGILYSSQAIGSITGAIGGGAMIRDNLGGQGDGWRWVLYLGAITLGLSAFGITVCYRPIPRPELNEKPYLQRLKEIDWVGSFLFTSGMAPLLVGIIMGGNKYPWKSAAPIACVAAGGLMLIVFGLHQRFIRKDGVLNHRLFKNRNFALCLAIIFVEGVAYITLNAFLGQQVAILYEQRPVYVGLHFATLLFCASLSASAWGYYSHRTKEMKIPLLIGYTMFIGASIGFSKAGTGPHADRIMYAMCALVGIGFGPPLALVLAIAQLAVDPDLTGLSSSLIIGIRSLGGATGAAIASAIFTAKLTAKLPADIAAAALQAGATPDELPAIIGFVAGGGKGTPPSVSPSILGAAVQGLRTAFAASFAYIYYDIIAWSALAIVLIIFLRPTAESQTWSITTPAEDYDKLGVHRHLDAIEEEKA